MFRPLAGLTRRNLGTEIMAGITLIAIAVPLNIGYAQIAGLPPLAGLYALVVPTLVWALIVSSRQLIASPDAAAAAVVANSLGALAVATPDNYAMLAMAQAVISGIMFLIMAVFRLGRVANFLSKPILIGFVGGLALDILVSQIAKMVGIKLPKGADFVEKVVTLVTKLDSIHVWSAVIAGLAIVVLVVGRRFAPRVPWALLVMIGATVLVVTAQLNKAGVDVLGKVDGGAPALTWPILDWATWAALVPGALALTLVTTAEGLLVSREYSDLRRYPISLSRDLAAFGAANLAAGAQGSFAMGASTSRTAAMDQAGSRTQLPSMILAGGTLLLLLFGTALLADVPSPAIGAIVGVAVVPLIGFAAFRQVWRLSRAEFWIAATCFAVTLLIGPLAGILVAFVLSLLHLATQTARPSVEVVTYKRDDPVLAPLGTMSGPGVVVLRMSAPLFFANAEAFVEDVKEAVDKANEKSKEPVKHVVIDMEGIADVDVTAGELLEGLADWITARGMTLSFSRAAPKQVQQLHLCGAAGTETGLFDTNRDAIAALSTKKPDVATSPFAPVKASSAVSSAAAATTDAAVATREESATKAPMRKAASRPTSRPKAAAPKSAATKTAKATPATSAPAKVTAKKTPAKATAAKSTTAKKTPAKKTPAKKTATAKSTAAKPTTPKSTAANKTPAKKAPAKSTAAKPATANKTPTKKTPPKKAGS